MGRNYFRIINLGSQPDVTGKRMNNLMLKTEPNPLKASLLAVIPFFFLLATQNLAAQAGGNTYIRKSIAYADILIGTENFQMSSERQRYFLDALHRGIHIARFDYNPLPEYSQRSLKERLGRHQSLSDEDVGKIIEATLLPELIKVLDIKKELRAQKLVTAAQKNSFIALKAKEIGITAEQLQKVMNASYLYVPFLSRYQLQRGKDKKDIDIDLEGGLIWYHIIAEGEPHIEKTGQIRSVGRASVEKDETFELDGERLGAEEYAFRNAVQTLIINLVVKTRELDFFKLQAPVAEVVRRKIAFPLGRAEGLHLDDPYFVGGWVETPSGGMRFEKSGFVRVSTVSDNLNQPGQLSRATAIKKGDWSRGMMVIEHPRLGIDVAFKPRWFSINVEEGLVVNHEEGFVIYFGDYTGATVGTDLDLQWNIARFTKRRQTFLVLGGTASLIPVESQIFDFAVWDSDWRLKDLIPTKSWIAGLFYGYVGYLKKWYLGPFAVHGEAALGIQAISISKHRGSDYYGGEDVTISNNSIGLRLNFGLEYAVNIDWNVGVFAGLQAFPPIDWWTVKYDEEEVDMENYYKFWGAPKMYSYSPTFGLYIHYSPPTLPFNPLSIAQSQLKKF